MMDQELLAAIRGMLQEELKPIKQDVSGLKQDMTGVKHDVSGLKQDMAGLDQKVTRIETSVNEIQAKNRKSHLEIVKRLDAIHDDVNKIDRRVNRQEEKAVR